MDIFVRFLLFIAIVGVTLAIPDKLGYSQDLQSSGSKAQGVVNGEDNVEENTEEEEKRPYSFAWKASRYYNGAPDREHIEERGEDGITRGVFRFVDPRHQVQEVVYLSDASGFHVESSNLPQDTPAVSAAKERHFRLFEKIRLEHERIGKLQDTEKESQDTEKELQDTEKELD